MSEGSGQANSPLYNMLLQNGCLRGAGNKLESRQKREKGSNERHKSRFGNIS
jgi:hypothetical protein